MVSDHSVPALRLCLVFFVLHVQRRSPLHSLKGHCHLCSGGHTRANRCMCAVSAASAEPGRIAKVPIQRLSPSHPPAVSADKISFVPFLPYNNEREKLFKKSPISSLACSSLRPQFLSVGKALRAFRFSLKRPKLAGNIKERVLV